MSNLLDKASIILTPTAYNNGEALCVKPSDGSGDFDFSRNSAATRVNAQGLVENVQSLSSNLITNGDFSSDTDWVKASGTTISGGKLNITANSTNDRTYQNAGIVQGKYYKVDFEVSNYVGGTLSVLMGGASTSNIGNITANGIYSFYQECDGANSFFYFKGNLLDASIDNVSVREVIDNTNLPRINYEGFSYDGSGNVVPDSGCGSWLFEPQSTNLVTYSEDFTNNSWSKFNSTASSSTIVNPEGTNGASLFVCDNFSGTNQYFRINPNTTYNNDVDYSYSMFVKYNTFQFCKLTYVNYAPAEHFTAVFDIINGTVTDTDTSGTPQNTSSKIEDFGNNWFRISISAAISSSSGNAMNFEFNKTPSGTPTFDIFGRTDQTTTTNDKVYVYGAQLEQQSYATSYIPTSGSTVTRNQDLCTNGGSLASINSTEGTLYFEGAALSNDGTNRAISINDGTTANRVSIVLGSGTNEIRGQVISSGTSFDFTTTSYNVLNNNKIAISYKLNDFSMWVNGTKVSTDTSGNTPSGMNVINFNAGGTVLPFFGKTKALAVWKEALTDAELTELTTI